MGRRLLTALGMVAVLCGAAPGTAGAGGTITPLPDRVNPAEHHVAGPAFAGDAVVYAVPAGRDGYSIRVQQPGGATSSQRVPARGAGPLGAWESVTDALAATPQVVALAHEYITCGDESGCKYQSYTSLENAVFAGALGGPLDFRGCSDFLGSPDVDASGGAIAYLDLCAGGAVVRDPAIPESSWRAFPANLDGSGDARIAGRYLAVDTRSYGAGKPGVTIMVYDWQSGEAIYRVPGDFGLDTFDIQDDGTLAFRVQAAGANEIFWASPQDPAAHPVTRRPDGFEDVRIADGKIAVGGLHAFVVFALDGTRLATTSRRDSVGAFDFDGKRLTYVDQPCEVSAVVTWDLSGKAPTMPAGKCPAALPAGPNGVVDLKRRRVTLPLRCPADPPLGCAGVWYADLNSVPPTHTWYATAALAPGEKRVVSLALPRKTACRLSRNPATRATIDLAAYDHYPRRPPQHRKVRFKLRTTGRARGCR